jgi:DinB superfamily
MSADLRFPIGRIPDLEFVSEADRQRMIADIADCPTHMRAAVMGLSNAQLDTPYREGGWTVRQVVHHVPDSHMNAYTRFKLGLTEEDPTIKSYDEKAWAMLGDTYATPVETSLALLENLHERWVILLKGIQSEDWMRHVVHPEMGPLSLDRLLTIYSWHSRHHVAHITELRKREGF